MRKAMLPAIIACILLGVNFGAAARDNGNDPGDTDQSGSKGLYTVYAFYKGGTIEGNQLIDRMSTISKMLNGKAEVQLVDITDSGAESLAKKYGVFNVPAVIVVSPDGVVTGGVKGIPEPSDVTSALIPDRMTEIIAAIQKNKLVLLLIKGKGFTRDDPSLQSVAAFQKIFKKSVETVELDVSLPQDAEVSRKFGVEATDVAGMQVLMLSAGGIVGVFSPPVSMRDLIGSFQRVLLSKSGCGGSNEGGLKSSCSE